MSRDERKPEFGVSGQVRHRPVCTVTEEGKKLEVSGLRRRRGGICSTIFVAKTKALISCAVIITDISFLFCSHMSLSPILRSCRDGTEPLLSGHLVNVSCSMT